MSVSYLKLHKESQHVSMKAVTLKDNAIITETTEVLSPGFHNVKGELGAVLTQINFQMRKPSYDSKKQRLFDL